MSILAALAVVVLALWIYLALGHAWFWRTDVELPEAGVPARWPAVAVVVPARDEAALLPATLPPLFAQDYPGPLSLVLVDDRSTDGTAAVGRRLAAAANRPLTVVAGSEPPPGWTGKLWALQHGLAALPEPAPDFVLFTDADIAHPPDSLRRLVAAALGGKRDLVSLMALLPAQRRWERLLIPAFVYFFAQLYPFRRVNRPGARTAAAAGGCLLVRLTLLHRAGGLEAVRGAVIDDVALAGLIKRNGGRIWLGLSSGIRSCRPYVRLADIWAMVARSAFTQLRHSYLLLALTVLGLVLTYLVPPLSVVVGLLGMGTGDGRTALPLLAAGAASWAIMAATYAPMLRHHGRPVLASLLLPVTAALYLLMTIDSARRRWLGRGAEWKGRSYGR